MTAPSTSDLCVLQCRDVHHSFGPKRVLHKVSFELNRGQVVALVGPSGCGKSTLLRAIVGTHPPQGGSLTVLHSDGTRQPVSGPGRDRGIVYQDYALFDFLTVRENVAFGLMLDETSPAYRLLSPRAYARLRRRHLDEAQALLERLGLHEAGGRYPTALSGGMRQRVAIAQTLIMKPEIMLLDEPFGALDEATREDLQRLLLRLYADNVAAIEAGEPHRATTIIIVTHELTEAIFVAHRVLGLSQYWDWRGAGHRESPGATVVYDKATPTYAPGSPKHHEQFVAQRQELYHAVFDADVCQPHDAFVKFWEQMAERSQSAASVDDGVSP